MARFEAFTKSLVPLAATPRVTVQKRGTITLNTAACAALGWPEAVELLYDRDAQVIGLRPVPVSAPNAAFVRPTTKSGRGPYVISAMAFLRYYQIDTQVARRWSATVEDGVLCIDLRGCGTEVSKRAGDEHRHPETTPPPETPSASDQTRSGQRAGGPPGGGG